MKFQKRVFPQKYTPGLKVSHLLFWLQYMTREVVRKNASFDNNWTPYMTLRECQLVFPNNRVALVTTQIVDAQHEGPFQASAFEGTYECAHMERKVESPTGHMMSEDVQRFIDEIAEMPHRNVVPTVDRRGATLYPDAYHRPALDGSFLYDDRHNFVPALTANRVLIGTTRWDQIVQDHTDIEPELPFRGGVLAVNRWCRDHCIDEFAWTGAGPIWMFRDHRDAFNFRMTWA